MTGESTWTSPVPVVNSGLFEDDAVILKQSGNTLWLFYSILNPTNLLSGYDQSDIQYVVSSDGGNTWGAAERFTYYSGKDYISNVVLLSGKPFVLFSSSRWRNSDFRTNLWYGLIGKTEDSNPPPAMIYYSLNAAQAELSAVVRAFVDDESGIADVKGEIFLNNVSQGFVQLYDDGMHNDSLANDNIWGTTIGPYNYEDTISVTYSITDISDNTVNNFGGWFSPAPVHNAGDLILSLRSNSQIAEEFYYGTSAFWHGYDYLYLGGLWIGADISGEKRVMNKDYYDEDWYKTEGSKVTMMPGNSDQGYDMFYDDGSTAPSPIGLAVHQKTYQWSDQGRDDFIVFKYIIKNTTSGNLDNLYASLWLDPDISTETLAYDDLGGYDSGRGMVYMYDSSGNPGGYLGLRLLTGTPSTAYLYTVPDPQTDEDRFQYMTSGIMPDLSTAGDYRMLLVSPLFSLAPGNSDTAAFGLVMGEGLEELHANADTMKALFDVYLVGNNVGEVILLPDKFNLSQNYPNPFNPGTKIKYSVPQTSRVQIKVFDILGDEIVTLVNEEKAAGIYEVSWNAANLPSGVYFYQLTASPGGGQAGRFVQTKKMILMK